MNIDIYDQELEFKMRIDGNYVSLYWEECYNSEGFFSLELLATDFVRDKIKPDYYVKRTDRKALMVVKSIQDGGGKFVVTGHTATTVLKDVSFVGTLKAGFNIHDGLQEAYNNTSKYPNVVFSGNAGFATEIYNYDISDKSMLELVQIVCQEKNIGYRAVKNGNRIEIEYFASNSLTNRNLKFSEEYGNLNNFGLVLSSENFKNYAYIIGETKEDGSRFETIVDIRDDESEPIRSIIVDVSNQKMKNEETEADYIRRIKGIGFEKLLECTKAEAVSFNPSPNEFGSRYDIGDILTVILNKHKMNVRVILNKYSLTDTRGSRVVKIEVGDPVIIRR